MYCRNCGLQIEQSTKYCSSCGCVVKTSRFVDIRSILLRLFTAKYRTVILIIGLFVVVGLIGTYGKTISPYDQEKVASSVVNIFCENVWSGDESTGGSGTIISEDGIVLTNSHIIPQNEEDLLTGDDGCLVVLPDPTTGQAQDVYLAKPLVTQGISAKYDLAFLQIYQAYYNQESGESSGEYPRKFPAFFDTTGCENNNPKLGDSIRIFGYPAISGGYSLTVTDGIVSSFPEEGFIVTSAKISQGNSGGLAVDQNGCMIGIPSMVSTDYTDNESLGFIISIDTINTFSNEVNDLMNN